MPQLAAGLKSAGQSATNQANQAQQYGQELEAGAPSAIGLPSNAPAQSLHGWGTAANVAGSIAPMALGAEGTGVPALTKALMGYLPEASTALGRLGTSIAGGGIGGGLFGGITAPAMQPTPEGQSYGEAAARNILPNAAMGAALGGGLSAIGETAGAARGMKNTVADWITKAKPDLPPEILSGEGTSDVLATAGKQFEGMTIPEIQRVSQGVGPDADAAKAAIQRLTVASGRENGVDLSLHDITQDPMGRNLEQSMEGDKRVLAMRTKQGAQIRQAIMDHQADYDARAAGMPFDADTPASAPIPQGKPLNPEVDDLHSMTPGISEAAAAGDKGALHVQGLIAGADTNPKMIQASLQSQYWKNRQIGNAIHDSFGKYLDGLREQDPFAFGSKIAPDGTQVPVTSIDPAPVISRLKAQIAENGGKDPAIDTMLNGYIRQLESPGTDLGYRGSKSIVSGMEDQIEGLKASGNRVAARSLFLGKNELDNAADAFALKGIGKDPEGLAALNKGSDWFKKNTLPFVDPDSGISDIMNGKDADKAVRPLFTDSSPDQFARIFGSLDAKGQAAVKAELIGRAEDGATRMKNFQSINLPSIARYMENRADQVGTAFGNDPAIPGLANLIRNTPRAGYQSNLNQALNAGQIGQVLKSKGIIGKADAAVGGIIDAGLNAVRVPKLFSPNLAEYAKGPALASPPVAPPTGGSTPMPTRIARPLSAAEYDALPPGTPYQSASGARGIKP
jgi:hypothetical protein